MGRDATTPGGTIKPHDIRPRFGEYLMIAGAAIEKNDIVAITGVNGARFTAIPANNSSIPHCVGKLFRAKSAAASGSSFLAEPVGIIDDVDTNARAVDDPVWLGLAGEVVFAAAGGQRRVGKVVKVGAAGVGLIAFDGQGPSGKHILTGQATIPNTATSVTVNVATLGISLGGANAWANLLAIDGTKKVIACTWSTNDLVITIDAAATANRLVAYQIEVG